MTIGYKIYKLRITKGLSQEQLARQIGESKQMIAYWESGVLTPDLQKIGLLSELFQISIDELIQDKDIQQEVCEEHQQEEHEKNIETQIVTEPVLIKETDEDMKQEENKDEEQSLVQTAPQIIDKDNGDHKKIILSIFGMNLILFGVFIFVIIKMFESLEWSLRTAIYQYSMSYIETYVGLSDFQIAKFVMFFSLVLGFIVIMMVYSKKLKLLWKKIQTKDHKK